MPRLTRRRFLGASTAAGATYILAKPTNVGSVQDTKIDHIKIHPAIGVARIGNSAEGFYIGPEVIEPEFTTPEKMRDAQGALKRQAARFRVYAYNRAGQVIRELTGDEVQLNWQVHLANKKAEWFRFVAAMDIPDSATLKCARRNPKVRGEERKQLIIDAEPQAIEGRNASPVILEKGRFLRTPVTLGELRTDEQGRLLVLGGRGRSESVPANMPPYNPSEPDTFNNADGWFDDTADGPVRVSVTIDGKEMKSSAWVIVGPPNYAPDVIGWRTMYDMLVDMYVNAGKMSLPGLTSFKHDILPILRRLSGLAWVNQGFEEAFGHTAGLTLTPPPDGVWKLDFDNPEHIKQLAQKTPPPNAANFRRTILQQFRTPLANQKNKRLWPMIYGDAYGTYDNSDIVNLSVSKTREVHLRNWVEGNYDDDWNVFPAAPVREISQVNVERQPAMLDRAALHFCLADAFHPGCELTWPMRHISMFDPDAKRNPFRIRERLAGESAPRWEATLTATNYKNFLNGQSAGDLTKWMAVPWQGDTIFCRSGYDSEFDPYVPTYWPARVPNHVLSEADYNIVMNINNPLEVRLRAYQRRKFWTRAITGDAPDQIRQMVTDFGRLGIVVAREGFHNDPHFPEVILVESLPQGLELAQPAPRVGQRSPEPNQKSIENGNDAIIKEFNRLRALRRSRR